jgi:hypothetical protein
LQHRRPLRPWEQQQQQITPALQQQQQQQQDDEALQRQSVLRQALAAVLAALQDATSAAAAGTDNAAVRALLPVLGPAVAFFASSMPALSGAQQALGRAAASVYDMESFQQ